MYYNGGDEPSLVREEEIENVLLQRDKVTNTERRYAVLADTM